MHKDTYELLQKLKERHKSEMLRYTKRDTPGDSCAIAYLVENKNTADLKGLAKKEKNRIKFQTAAEAGIKQPSDTT